MQFIVFKTCLVTKFVCSEEKENEPTWGWVGSNGTFDFLFTLGAIETWRCKWICDIESVLITKTGIKGD